MMGVTHAKAAASGLATGGASWQRQIVQAFLVFVAGWLFAGQPLFLASAPALSWQPRDGYRELAVAPFASDKESVGFKRLAPEQTGIWFTNALAADRHYTNQILLNGSGVAAGDVDGDGWCDLYFCGLDAPNALYRNLGGWKFEEIGRAAGVDCPDLDATGAAFADLDGDADMDLVVNSIGGGTHVFFNDGHGHFTRLSDQPVLNPRRGGSSLALGDLDGDGDLDLYVANYRTVTLRDQPNTRFTFRMINGKPQVVSINDRPLTDPEYTNRFEFKFILEGGRGTFIHDELGEPDVLYRNDGHGRFTPVSFTDGTFRDEDGRPLTQAPLDWGLSVVIRDLNQDGAPDIYVVNDFRSPDRVWINDGHGRFRALDRLAVRHTCLSAMGMDVADINRDGYDDFFVYDMLAPVHERRYSQRVDLRSEELPFGVFDNRPQYSRNMLQLNRGDFTYAEIACYSHVEASDWSWTPIFLDVDLDGYEDLLVSNGFERDNMNVDALRKLEALKKGRKLPPLEQLRLRRLFPKLATPNLLFHNLGNLRFEEVGQAWGFHDAGISQGMAVADLDNDGDLDVAVNNLNDVAGIYRNETAAPRVQVRLRGLPPNTAGIGARITVRGGPVVQTQEIQCGGRYCSSDQPVRTFAAGSLDNRLTIEVRWRSGRHRVLKDLAPNRIYEIVEQADDPPAVPQAEAVKETVFTDATAQLGHRHAEEPFDDFARQPLLPRQLSQLSPGVTWFDVDQDGWEDLLIASGRGGHLGVLRNQGDGRFAPLTDPPFNAPVTRDQTTLLPWWPAPGKVVLLAGSANYEDGLALGSCARTYDLSTRRVVDLLPGQASSTGPLALADVDKDGDLDLFVGGRVIAARYPEPATSLMFRAEAGQLKPDTVNNALWEKVGLVSGAAFSDLDSDGDPDLVLACEWGPVRVFRNTGGRFTEATADLGLERYRGWWTGVATGDFDNDGRPDILAANWGRNSEYEWVHPQPVLAYYGDMDGNGAFEVLLAYHHGGMGKVVPLVPYHRAIEALPFLQQQVQFCSQYAKMGLEEIFGRTVRQMPRVEAGWLETTLFLNRGDRFEARPLPAEAQFAPAFAVCVGDLDGDGNQDAFLSQNFFGVHPDFARLDAGRGLWLRGDGQGGLRPVPGQRSGLRIYGEQRGAALADYDHDGRLDLAVSQNANATRLFRNRLGKPGLRVRLQGPPLNPPAIGAKLRLDFGEKQGPVHEIQAGSGYWSCAAFTVVLSTPQSPQTLHVWWPSGRHLAVPVPQGARELLVTQDGKVRRTR